MCILRLQKHSHDGVRKEQISKTGMSTLVTTLFTIFTPLSISSHTTNTHALISFLTVQRGAGQAPRNGARRSTSRGNSGIFARLGHKSEGRILLSATAPMKTTSNYHRAPKAPIRLMPLAPKATCICRRNCI